MGLADRARAAIRNTWRLVLESAARLTDSEGRPFNSADLGREHGAPMKSGPRAWGYASVATGLTPKKLAALIAAADGGTLTDLLTLAGEIERRDSHCNAQLRTRKLALAALPWKVDAVADDARSVALAEEVQALVNSPAFFFLVLHLMDAVLKGFAVVEIAWKRGAKWTPIGYTWRDQRHFAVSKDDGTTLRVRTEAQPQDGEDMPAFVYITHRPAYTSGPLTTAGLMRPLSVLYSIKTLGVGAWLAYMEVFGVPTRLGRYSKATSEDDITALRKAVAAIGFDGYGVLPETAKVELLDAIGRGSGTGEHERLAEWVDRQASKAILGQTMTADSGSSLSQAQIHQLVRRDILLADAQAVAATLQRDLINVYIDINYGTQESYPRLRCVTDEPEDRKAFVDSLVPLVDRGLAVEESVVRDRIGLPAPAPGAEVLAPKTTAAPASTVGAARRLQRASFVPASEAHDDDFIDELTDPPAGVVQPLLDEVRQAADAESGFTGFLARLAASTADADKLVKDLATRQFKARGVGDATDEVQL